ncbi:MAG: hypothetical protein ACMXYK_04870 [Candidatus Woesearchaeota archaeon]
MAEFYDTCYLSYVSPEELERISHTGFIVPDVRREVSVLGKDFKDFKKIVRNFSVVSLESLVKENDDQSLRKVSNVVSRAIAYSKLSSDLQKKSIEKLFMFDRKSKSIEYDSNMRSTLRRLGFVAVGLSGLVSLLDSVPKNKFQWMFFKDEQSYYHEILRKEINSLEVHDLREGYNKKGFKWVDRNFSRVKSNLYSNLEGLEVTRAFNYTDAKLTTLAMMYAVLHKEDVSLMTRDKDFITEISPVIQNLSGNGPQLTIKTQYGDTSFQLPESISDLERQSRNYFHSKKDKTVKVPLHNIDLFPEDSFQNLNKAKKYGLCFASSAYVSSVVLNHVSTFDFIDYNFVKNFFSAFKDYALENPLGGLSMGFGIAANVGLLSVLPLMNVYSFANCCKYTRRYFLDKAE